MAWSATGTLNGPVSAAQRTAFVSYVNHGSTAGTARPTGANEVFWDGTVAPTNAVTGDRWFDTTANVLRRYNGTTWAILGGAPVVQAFADAATITPDIVNYTTGYVATMSQNFTIANPTGTPQNFLEYKLRIKATVARTITWGSQYRAGVDILALPTALSGGSLTDYFGFLYNAQDTKWDLVAVARGY